MNAVRFLPGFATCCRDAQRIIAELEKCECKANAAEKG